MKLQVKPHNSNQYPLEGFLIKSGNINLWINQLQDLKIDLENTPVFAIPGTIPNTLWGCLVILTHEKWNHKLTSQEPCQFVNNRLFIPHYSSLYPTLSIDETERLFGKHKHILHPEFGLFALEVPLDWTSLITIAPPSLLKITTPANGPFIPRSLKKIELQALPPDQLITAMEENMFPKKEEFENTPLKLFEKIKLRILRVVFSHKKNGSTTGENKLLQKLKRLFPTQRKWFDNLEKDLESLEERNNSEMEKLLDLFKKNPEEALKYAIPLDNHGLGRGGNGRLFKMSKRWSSFDLSGSRSGRAGNALSSDESFQKLQNQYTNSAREFIRQKDYKKAAFVYMKLLKDYYMAAQTLEEGKMYSEAASVYLKYFQNKNKAAECYEKGQMTTDAIKLYIELGDHEKAGDLYITQDNKKEAFEHYNIVIDDHKTRERYVKAALLYRQKMGDLSSAQELLLDGWKEEKDAFNCLNNYFNNIEDDKILANQIEHIYIYETNKRNKAIFLSALKHEHNKGEKLKELTRQIAYEIIAELIEEQPSVVSELNHFNDDRSLVKDVVRFRSGRKK